jgi:general stress protein 26
MTKTLSDISEAMRDIDFCMLVSRAPDGAIGGRPMSNNREVAYEGTSWFFTLDDAQMVGDLARDPSVGLTYQGKAGLLGLVGAPGMFIHVEGTARLIHDKLLFAKHWDDSMARWFKQGIDTPGMVLIEVEAKRIHYWDGEDSGEVALRAPVEA